MKYPDRYIIVGKVKEGENKGKTVYITWTEEGGGWWQWTAHEAWAYRFEKQSGPRFEDAMRCAKGETWTKSTCGPWFYYADINTVKSIPTPAIVKVY